MVPPPLPLPPRLQSNSPTRFRTNAERCPAEQKSSPGTKDKQRNIRPTIELGSTIKNWPKRATAEQGSTLCNLPPAHHQAIATGSCSARKQHKDHALPFLAGSLCKRPAPLFGAEPKLAGKSFQAGACGYGRERAQAAQTISGLVQKS